MEKQQYEVEVTGEGAADYVRDIGDVMLPGALIYVDDTRWFTVEEVDDDVGQWGAFRGLSYGGAIQRWVKMERAECPSLEFLGRIETWMDF